MTRETLAYKPELEPMAIGLTATFFQRRDIYARQLDDGSYVCIRKPLEISHLIAHLEGEITLGTYVLDPSSQARYIVFDADDETQFERLIHLHRSLATQDAPSYLEESRRGGHLWLFFSNPLSGKDARLFGQSLSKTFNLLGAELFPKQSRLKDGPGSLIRLPFGVHRRDGVRYGFVNLDSHPLANSFTDQLQILSAPKTVPEAFIKRTMTKASIKHPAPVSTGVEKLKRPLSELIKESISVHDFVSRYIELSPAGRGKCPFHDDQHASFSVNTEGNYWHCFAGCGGGSIIDFWIRYRKCDFKLAVQELARMLLK